MSFNHAIQALEQSRSNAIDTLEAVRARRDSLEDELERVERSVDHYKARVEELTSAMELLRRTLDTEPVQGHEEDSK